MEWIAVSIGIGLIVSLLFTEASGLNVGGMIVPGYLAMYMDRPLTVALTIAAAMMTWGCVRAVNHWAILFGRRRVMVTMLVGFAIASLVRAASAWIAVDPVSSEVTSATVIGFVIPGLIALWIDRQGFVLTVSPLIVATSLVRLVLVVCGIEGVA